MGDDHSGSGTGAKLTKATVVVCGVASLVATVLSFVYVALALSMDFLLPYGLKSFANERPRNQIDMASDVGLNPARASSSLINCLVGRIIGNRCSRDTSFGSCSCMLSSRLELGETSYTMDRVPIYSASSYASLMSQTAAFYIDPLRDIYEVNDMHPLVLATLKLRITGFHNIHLLPTSHQLPRWRALAHRNDAWKTTITPSVAIAQLPPESGHFRSPHLSLN